MAMVGTTRAGDPIPPASIFAEIVRRLDELAAKVDALGDAKPES